MSKVRITLDLEEIKALSNIIYCSDLDKIPPLELFYVDPKIMLNLKELICHSLNLLDPPEYYNCEVVE